MILSDTDILEKIEKKEIFVNPFIKENLQPSTLDLQLSGEVRVFENWKLSEIDVYQKQDATKLVNIPQEGFVIHPGEFILGSTEEEFNIPADIAAKLEGRSSLGRLGLIIHATAGYVDPGFTGWLTFEISNLSHIPIRIYKGMKIAQICFFQMKSPAKNPYGSQNLSSKYQGQKGPTASRYWQDKK